MTNTITNTTHQSGTQFAVTGMTCGKCVQHIHASLSHLGEATVTLQYPQIVLAQMTALASVQSALNGTRYAVSLVTSTPENPTGNAMQAQTPTHIEAKSSTQTWLSNYRPLLLLVAYILMGSLLVQSAQGEITLHETMRYFMAGFFLAFSFFKLLDLSAFATAYAGYDLLAARWKSWGMIYPFIELGLGLAYLSNWQPVTTNYLTMLAMGFSAIGVIRAVLSKKTIACACLGSVFKLPMSTVTIVEDVGMVLMAAWMLY